MNNIKLVSLQIDDVYIHFKDGLNYIVGRNASGKTTIFNCIKYALGMVKSLSYTNIEKIELTILLNGSEFLFRRDVGSPALSISLKNEVYNIRAQSKELNSFLRENLLPKYIYEESTESVLEILDFCFLTDEKSTNRRQQWQTLCSICGINVSLLNSVEKDMHALKKEITKNKEVEKVVNEFSKLLSENLRTAIQIPELDENIDRTKNVFFGDFREKEDLLISATIKLEKIKERSSLELAKKINDIEDAFIGMKTQAGFSNNYFEGLEEFIKNRSKSISYGEETFSRFVLVLAVAHIAVEGSYNFPRIIVNDSYLSLNLDNNAYHQIKNLLNRLMSQSEGLQYIEFTSRDDIPKEHIVLNLNGQGGQYVFGKY